MGVFPHCDQAVLHAPGECKYCDGRPDWQELRQLWGIAFTGHPPTAFEVACPSDARRPNGISQRWPGNQPQPRAEVSRSFGDVPEAAS